MQRAKINFLPSGVSQYLNIAEKYSGWSCSTDNIKTDGFIYTDEKSTIEEINSNYWFKLVADVGYKITRIYQTNAPGIKKLYEYAPNDYIYPRIIGSASIINNYFYVEVEEDITYNLKQNLTNCTSNISGDTIEETEGKEIILTCDDGYVFNEVPTITIGNNTFEFNLNDDLTNATITVDITGDVIINAVAVEVEEDITYNLKQNLTNCTSNISGDTIEETEGKEIILTCNDGFIFKEMPTITIGNNTFEFNLNDDLTDATITVDITGDVIINAVATKKVGRVYITGTFENATCNYSNGDFLEVGKNIIITANAGYTFKAAYSYRRGGFTKFFTNYGPYLEYEIDENDLKYDFYLDEDFVATKDVEQLGSFVNLYKTNQEELTELSKVRFYSDGGQIVDYGQFITSLYVLPFDIPDDILGDKSPILLGNFDSRVKSTLISTYSFDVDGGTIEVPLKYNNIYDYVNTECILHLPFLDKVYLNTEYVIGQKLTITFTIELYSGTLTANIKSSFNNEIVASVQGLIGMNIPFIQKSNGNTINSISNVYKNKTNRCFIEVNRNIPYTKNNNVFGGGVVEYGRIGDYTGYLECDKIVLETNATNQEQEEIENLLRNGVFI